MSSFSPVWRVELRLESSRLFLALTAGLHALALLALLQTGLAVGGQLTLGVALLGSLLSSWRRERARAGLVVREQHGAWLVGDMRAELQHCQVWRYLVVMDFRGIGPGRRRRQRVVVLPDAVPPATFRRLRVRLLYGRRQIMPRGQA